MADTITRQVRSSVNVEGVEKFKLYIEVIDKGDLPSLALFLVQIVDTADPKQDVFQRVVTIADLETYLEDRTTVIAAHETLYRVSTYTLYYDNLETAVAAQSVIKSRIDELVIDWKTYVDSFETTSETTTHPQLSLDMFNAAVADYTTALTAEKTAEATRDAAKETYDDAVTGASEAAGDLTDAQGRSAACSEALTSYNNLLAAHNTLYNNANTFRTAGGVFAAAADTFDDQSNQFDADAQIFLDACTADPPTTAEKSIFQGQINTHITNQGTFSGALSTFDGARASFNTQLAQALAEKTEAANAWLGAVTSLCSDLASEVTTAQTAKQTADTLVATTRTDYEDAQAAYEAAQAVTEAALATVRALKPDYDPNATS